MDSAPTITYGPKRGTERRTCFVLLGVATGLAILALLGAGPRQLESSFAVGFLVSALAMLQAIFRNVPRLTIDHDGLTERSLSGIISARWNELGAFTLVERTGSAPGRPLLSAWAPIVQPEPGRRSGETAISLQNLYDVPLDTILNDIAARHVANVTPADATNFPVDSLQTATERPVGVAGFRWPWLTLILFAAFIVVFALEQRLAVTPQAAKLTPSALTLLSLGGLYHPRVMSGEWYRLLIAPFLHASLVHLVGNGIAFVLAGYALERLVGRVWMFCIFAGGAIAGSFMSMALINPRVVSVGASGAIMAMLVALFLISFRLPSGSAKAQIQAHSARVVVPAVIPLHSASTTIHVDYGAHFGGLLFGAALGCFLLRTWRDDSRLPRFRRAAASMAALVVAACASSAAAVAWRYPLYSNAAQLIPHTMVTHDQNEMNAKADSLVAAYPRDPRGYVLQARVRFQRRDLPGAEQALRAALPLAETNEYLLGRSLTNTVRATLAFAIMGQHRETEAKTVAREPCEAKAEAAPDPKVMANLKSLGLCGPAAATMMQ